MLLSFKLPTSSAQRSFECEIDHAVSSRLTLTSRRVLSDLVVHRHRPGIWIYGSYSDAQVSYQETGYR